MLTAKVKKSFPGVPDGQTQPILFEKGDTVTGDLARVAIEEKWASKTKSQAELDAEAKAKEEAEAKAKAEAEAKAKAEAEAKAKAEAEAEAKTKAEAEANADTKTGDSS